MKAAGPVNPALAEVAAAYAATAIDNVEQEYPNDLRHVATGPEDRPRPREAHPAFYGSYDWHSCVEMHWVLVRLLKLVPDRIDEARVREVLDAHLGAGALAAEAAYMAHPKRHGFQRPYGWGWVLALADELAGWDDPDGWKWWVNIRPLADVVAGGFVGWLPKCTYAVRYGFHNNSAFALTRALGWARRRAADGDGELLGAIRDAARRWFEGDADYPAGWEPSGADFLSPALTEAVLMAEVLDTRPFRDWFRRFLPGVAASEPSSLFTPAVVSDPTDGQIAHLHGLNLSRAWCFERLVAAVGAGDPRATPLRAAARSHADASLAVVTGSDYMVSHWLAAYAVLLLAG